MITLPVFIKEFIYIILITVLLKPFINYLSTEYPYILGLL